MPVTDTSLYNPATTIQGYHRPCDPTPCVIAGPGWSAWYFFVATLNLEVLECYTGSPSCSWIHTAAAETKAQHLCLWSDFPLQDSMVFTLPSLVFFLSGSPSTFEHLLPMVLARHLILYHTSSDDATCASLPHWISVTHHEVGGVLEGTWVFQSNMPFGPLASAPPRYPRQLVKTIGRPVSGLSYGEPPLDISEMVSFPVSTCSDRYSVRRSSGAKTKL